MKRTKTSQQRFENLQREMAAADRAADRIVADRFHSFLMSDTKWCRVLNFLKEHKAIQQPFRWKFVDSESIFESRILCVADRGFELFHGVAAFRHIERVGVVSPAAGEIQGELAEQGLFDIEPIADGFKLYGYR